MAVGSRAPQRVACGAVDDEVAVALHPRRRARMTISPARPQRHTTLCIQDEVAVALHEHAIRTDYTIRARAEEWKPLYPSKPVSIVDDEIAVTL